VQAPQRCNTASNRDEALALLANPNCVDTVVDAIARYSPEDLAAAYYVRAQWRDDPGDLLMAWREATALAARAPEDPRTLFNLALIQERLGLTARAINTWNRVVAIDKTKWGEDARQHRDALNAEKPVWREADMENALAAGQRSRVRQMVATFPSASWQYFEDHAGPGMLAEILDEGGDPYARAIYEAAQKSSDREALEQGLVALDREQADRAEQLFARANNPLRLVARYEKAAALYRAWRSVEARPVLLQLVADAKASGYTDLLFRSEMLLATVYADLGEYGAALALYEPYVASDRPDYAADALMRRATTRYVLGDLETAWNDLYRAVQLLPRVTDGKTITNTYNTILTALSKTHPDLMLAYQEIGLKETAEAAKANRLSPDARERYTSTLRFSAGAALATSNVEDAKNYLERARASMKFVSDTKRQALQSAIDEVAAQIETKQRPEEAIGLYTALIEKHATGENPSNFARLLIQRAAAYRLVDQHDLADADIDKALAVIHVEQDKFLSARERGNLEDLWSDYFSRFLPIYQERISSLLENGQAKAALIASEHAKAFEPMHLLMHSQKPPAGFAPIRSAADLDRLRSTLPNDTWIIQYAVLESSIAAWVISRDGVHAVPIPASASDVRRWLGNLRKSETEGREGDFETTLQAAYDGLIASPWSKIRTDEAEPRIVIVPDGPMHGLPFSAFARRVNRKLRFLTEDAIVSFAGSTSLYFYSVARDAEMRQSPGRILAVGDPDFARGYPGTENLTSLAHARNEAACLEKLYGPRTTKLTGADATVAAFLEHLADSTIVHVGAHGTANEVHPRHSMLLMARDGKDSGRLTAERLITDVPSLDKTRLVVLAACSTAGGKPVGPEGVAPLVRPFLGANVPAVVGSLWDVNDATTNELVVSFHCHYRNGHDVAAALRQAQLTMIRDKTKSSFDWAPFQVIGYARSPYEDQDIEFSCQDFLLGADGPRSQSERH
jgi:CHAT domain-containing protein